MEPDDIRTLETISLVLGFILVALLGVVAFRYVKGIK